MTNPKKEIIGGILQEIEIGYALIEAFSEKKNTKRIEQGKADIKEIKKELGAK